MSRSECLPRRHRHLPPRCKSRRRGRPPTSIASVFSSWKIPRGADRAADSGHRGITSALSVSRLSSSVGPHPSQHASGIRPSDEDAPNFDSRDSDFEEDQIKLGAGVVTEVTLALVDAERRHKQAGFNTQRVSKLVDVQKRDVPLSPLDRTHISAVDASSGSKGLLG